MRRIIAPCMRRQRSAASAVCNGYMNNSSSGAKMGLRRAPTKLTMVASLEIAAGALRCATPDWIAVRCNGAAAESLALNAPQEHRETLQVLERAFHGGDGGVNRFPQDIAERGFHDDHREQRKEQTPNRPRDDGAYRERGRERRRATDPDAIQLIRRARPGVQDSGCKAIFGESPSMAMASRNANRSRRSAMLA